MSERLPPLAESDLNDAQRKARQAVIDGPRKGFGGPFAAMLRSPELTDRVQRVGEYLRWDSALPAGLREIAILTVVRRWENPVEWASHVKAGAAEGLTPALMSDISAGRRPQGSEAEQAVYDFVVELLDTHHVGDANYARVRDAVGEEGLVDILGLTGYYVIMAAVLNVARTPVPGGAEPFSV